MSGGLSFVEGSRRLSSLRFDADLERDPDLTAFVAFDSETDALPVGEVRKLWNADALAKLQPELDSAEEWARSVGLAACERLARRFGGVS